MEHNQLSQSPETQAKKSIPRLLGQLGIAYLTFAHALVITAREELPPAYKKWRAERTAQKDQYMSLDDKVK